MHLKDTISAPRTQLQRLERTSTAPKTHQLRTEGASAGCSQIPRLFNFQHNGTAYKWLLALVLTYGGLVHPIIGVADNRFAVVLCDCNSDKLHIDFDFDFEDYRGNQTQVRRQTRRKHPTALHT